MTETIPYEITGTVGEVEFRRYAPLILATVQDDGDDRGFRLLFAYITGSNQTRSTIPMTAPVITSEQIPMTAPVISGSGSMSFVMPAGRTRDLIPDPLDNRVSITTVPARDLAVIRFSGHARPEDVEAVTFRLLDELKKDGIAPEGAPFLMRYNAPFTPGFLRRNEVGVQIQR